MKRKCTRVVSLSAKTGKQSTCARPRWKAGLCGRCFKAKEAEGHITTVKVVKTKKQRVAKKQEIALPEGNGMPVPYRLSKINKQPRPQQLTARKLQKTLMAYYDSHLAQLLTRRQGNRYLDRNPSVFLPFAVQVCAMMRDRGEDFKHIFGKMRKPVCYDAAFITALPPSEYAKRYNLFTRCPALHRDLNDPNHYSVFFLLTKMTEDNGSVLIYPGTHNVPRHFKDNAARVEGIMAKGEAPNKMVGDVCDCIAFDARLLHRSLNSTADHIRVLFAFTIYDSDVHNTQSNRNLRKKC